MHWKNLPPFLKLKHTYFELTERNFKLTENLSIKKIIFWPFGRFESEKLVVESLVSIEKALLIMVQLKCVREFLKALFVVRLLM